MLVHARMTRLALAAVLLAATASTASAGTYVGLGIGTSPATSGDVAMLEDGRSGRLQLGYRFGPLSVEGLASRADLARDDGASYSWTTLGIAGRFNYVLGGNFEAFGRLGYQGTSVDQSGGNDHFSGSGLLFGGGFEYRLNLGLASGSLFVDYTVEHANLHREGFNGMDYGLTSRVWTLGAILSL
jgi:hypothetical protein